MGRIAPFAKDHPLEIALGVAALLVAITAAIVLSTPVVRQALRKFFFLSRNSLTADRGWRDLAYWIIVTALLGLPFAVGGGFRNGPTFDWRAFVSIFVLIGCANGVKTLIEMLSESGRFIRPVHGVIWRSERKISTAAILNKVAVLLSKPSPAPPREVRDLLRDLLGVLASHVRDHRGNHRTAEVFANLLLVDGDDVVVVARDPTLHRPELKRTTPARAPKTALAVCRVLSSRCPVVVGDYRLEYPESVKTRPYSAILGLPLMSSDDSQVIGIVSIDSTRPYFFESFTPGEIANHLENSLAPYLKTIVLVLERLLSPDPAVMLALLLQAAPTGSPQEGS